MTWTPPPYASLHWDSKLMPKLADKDKKEERLAIAIGTKDGVKLLGTPCYEPKTDQDTGTIVATKTMELLDQWQCSHTIVNMTFDTTASNTGNITASCVTIQQYLERALLWAGCRHHVGEVILTHVFDDLKIEASKSPESSLFGRFQANYGNLAHTPLKHFDMNDFKDEAIELIQEMRPCNLLQCGKDHEFRRDDYKEVIELCILFLHGNMKTPYFTFKKPGAMHKARWMAKLIYSLKICLLENQISILPPGTITTKQQRPKLRRFVTFVTLVYIPWWLTTGNTTDAPYHDYFLYEKLIDYAKVDSEVSASAIKAFNRHLWYLTGEMTPLILFNVLAKQGEKDSLRKRPLDQKPETEKLSAHVEIRDWVWKAEISRHEQC